MKCAYWWLGIPLVIFLLTWFRYEIGIPFGILSIWAIWKATAASSGGSKIHVGKRTLIWTLLITFIWILLSGIGGFFYQLPLNNAFRNALFNELVNNPAPVIKYDDGGTPPQLICYYHAFWMLPAVFAKLTGSILVGNIVQFAYAWIGMMIVSMLVFQFVGKAKIWVVLLMLTFCGWEIVNDLLINGWNGITYLFFKEKDIASKFLSAPSFRILTCYIYNQGIAAWMASIILYLNRNNTTYLMTTYSLMVYFAPFPALGVFPFVGFYLLRNFRNAMSLNNIAGLLFCILITIYFSANKHGSNPHLIFDIIEPTRVTWLLIAFIICSYGIYIPFIWHKVKHNILFWSMMAWSLIIPMIILASDDVNMGTRVSIPFMCYFTIMVIREAAEIQWQTLRGNIFAVVLAVGITSNISTALSVIKGEIGCIVKGRTFSAQWMNHNLFNKDKNLCYDNFIAEGESLYTRYFISNKISELNTNNPNE